VVADFIVDVCWHKVQICQLVFYALSDVYVEHPRCCVGSCILVVRQNCLSDKTTACQLEND
jgi:hypothetical protein